MTTADPTRLDESGAVDHRGLQVLDLEECLHKVASVPMGRIAFRDRGDLAVLPVTHVIDDVTVAFRARWDSRLVEAVHGDSVSYEVDDYDGISGTGWSVLLKGTAAIVDDEAECRQLEQLLDVPWTGLVEESLWVRIRPDEVTGRELVTSRESSGCC